MNNFDFDAQTPISRDRIYLSWSETCSVARYIEEYLKSRRLRTDDAARAHIHHFIKRYPWTGPLRKPDVDQLRRGQGHIAQLMRGLLAVRRYGHQNRN